MKRSTRTNDLFELLLGLAIVGLVLFIGSFARLRADLTDEKRYTLTPSTKQMLEELPDVVYVKVYLTGELPADLQRFSRSIREFDVGDFSAAGGRSRFEELHRNYIQPRKPLPNLTQVAAEFEMYRKLAQNQFQKMQTASTAGARDGEQRASQFLSRIAAKIRNARHKR